MVAVLIAAVAGGSWGTIARAAKQKTFQIRFAQLYNKSAARNHWPGRIVGIACSPDKVYGHDCDVVLQSRKTFECAVVAVDAQYNVLQANQVKCPAYVLPAKDSGPKA